MRILISAIMLLSAPLAAADLKVFACEPEWAALAVEIGAEHVEATSATTAFQDPHYVQARPSLIAGVRKADLVICSGAELEVGWLPVLLQKANNRNVMPGTSGYIEASSLVDRHGETGTVDRAQGDIHPLGNPHVQADPRNIPIIAAEMARRFGELDPGNAPDYQASLDGFLGRWQQAIASWEEVAQPLRGKRVITHHNSWVYLERWLGLNIVANLEAVPGIPPTVAHLSSLKTQFAGGGADAIIRSPYQDVRASKWLSERTGIPAIELPLTVGGSDDATDLFALFDTIIDKLLETTQ